MNFARQDWWSSLVRMFVSRNWQDRDQVIDQFRGVAIIAMILVNHAPPEVAMYSIFTHKDFIGWTVADTIFPMFLFVVGLSISFLTAPRWRAGVRGYYAKLIRRTVLLILISVALVNFPYYDFDNFRIHGTLMRIGVCYFAASLIHSYFRIPAQVATVALILAVQHVLLTSLDVPGFGQGNFTVEGNASAYLDQLVFGELVRHLQLFEPITQGLLPTAGAIATTLIGVITGSLMRRMPDVATRISNLFAPGFLFMAAGGAWSLLVPISKPLWSPSYVILMAGISLQTLALLYWFDRRALVARSRDYFAVAGANALFFYVFAQSLQRILVYGRFDGPDGTPIRFRYFIFENLFESWLPGKAGAFLYTVSFLLVCYAVVFMLHKHRVFIKL